MAGSAEPPVSGPALILPPVILGTMARSDQTPANRIELFRHALERGITCFDTAPLYGFGAAERQLGAALKDVPRDSVRILGKVGLRWDGSEHGAVHFHFTDDEGRQRTVRRDSRGHSVAQEVEESLKRLNTDYLDLVQVHFIDEQTPLEQTLDSLADVQRQGLVRQIGLCNATVEQARLAKAALQPDTFASVQCHFNLLQRAEETRSGLISWCTDNDVAVLAYSPLAEGLLAGTRLATLQERLPRRVAGKVHQALQRESSSLGVPSVAIALGWVIAQPGICSAIVGASSIAQLDEQLKALELIGKHDELSILGRELRNCVLRQPWEVSLVTRGLRRLRRILNVQ